MCRLLTLCTSDNVLQPPSFQLLDAKPVQGLTDVLHTMHTGTRSRWTWTSLTPSEVTLNAGWTCGPTDQTTPRSGSRSRQNVQRKAILTRRKLISVELFRA